MEYINFFWDNWPISTIPIVLLILLCVVYGWKPLVSIFRGKPMSKWEKEKIITQTIEDAFVEGIEQLRYKGIISQMQKEHLYDKFAAAMDLPGLKPKNPNALKAKLRGRIGQNTTPVNIPGEKPVQELKPNKYPTSRLSAVLFGNKP